MQNTEQQRNFWWRKGAALVSAANSSWYVR